MKMWRMRRRKMRKRRNRKKEEQKQPESRIFQRKFVHMNNPFITSVK
jgi:hypothetical protein